MVSLRHLALLATAASAAPASDLHRRDMAAVETELQNVAKAMKAVTTSLDEYPGGLLPAFKLRKPQNDLEAALAKATAAYKAEPEKMSDADGQKGVDFAKSLMSE